MRLEIVGRNVAHPVPPTKVDAGEIEILTAEQITGVLDKLSEHPLRPS
jgi:hypothetical protein